ncbi:MAG: hypothetical protein WCX84_04055 [Syntrophales bacterium]|jgi:hypothetical protein|nr:hypothetical protein [Syntrophales bacterium]NLN59732.1 hypothetical protein [Deltaproteobacteria bacterium]
MIHPKDTLKQMIDINKSICANAFNNMSTIHDQMEKVVNIYIGQASGMSEEGKKAVREWASMYRKGFEDFKKLVEDNFAKMESFFQDKK